MGGGNRNGELTLRFLRLNMNVYYTVFPSITHMKFLKSSAIIVRIFVLYYYYFCFFINFFVVEEMPIEH